MSLIMRRRTELVSAIGVSPFVRWVVQPQRFGQEPPPSAARYEAAMSSTHPLDSIGLLGLSCYSSRRVRNLRQCFPYWRMAVCFRAIVLVASFALTCNAAEWSPFASPASNGISVRAAVDATACSTRPLGSTTIDTYNGVPTASLSANGHPMTLIIDTGAQRTVLTPAAAQRVGAQPPSVEFKRQMRGIAGTLQTNEVELNSFFAGNVALPWRRVLVAPVTIMSKPSSGPLDGLLGADVLSDFDIDLDFPGRRITFYEKQSCPSAVPEWAGSYAEINTGRSLADHLFFPVRIDGRQIVAIIDTGAQRTTLSTAAAQRLGVSEAILARDRSITARGAAGEQLSSRVHRFLSLEIGGEVMRSPELVVADIAPKDADIVLGIDFLSSRRLWLS